MKFSYVLIKKLVPGLKNKKQLADLLTEHSFEAVEAEGGSFEVAVPANRFSDAASHWGIAKEISAILGGGFQFSIPAFQLSKTLAGNFQVFVKDKKLCKRYAAWRFSKIKIKPSPVWMRKILKDCGLRPINNVVDIMNYAMLETGQPLHAFDADKIGKMEIRRAKNHESIETLDGIIYKLNSDVLVISDAESPLAIAGVKGGKKAEVDGKTRNIIVEAANFDGPNIYKTSKFLNLKTDASLRFSHGLSPALVDLGLGRAKELLEETGVKVTAYYDSRPLKNFKKIIEFDVEKFNCLIGFSLSPEKAADYLQRLGFVLSKNSKFKAKNSFLVEAPLGRQDIENFEDLAEEVGRLYGYNKIKALPPEVPLKIAEAEDIIVFKDQLRKILTGFGASEVYNYSFVSAADMELRDFWDFQPVGLENPISSEYEFLRPHLTAGLLRNIQDNFRFFDKIRIFEIGKVFMTDAKLRMNSNLRINPNNGAKENWRLGIALGFKNKETVFELKGLVSELLKKAGLVDFFMHDADDGMLIIKSGSAAVGYLSKGVVSLSETANISVCEIDLGKLLELVEDELEFRPLPKYPSVMRDISILVNSGVRIGEILEAMNSPEIKYVDDVDLIDEYFSNKLGDNRQSLTFRIVFRSDEKTLEDKEADKELAKIINILKEKFGAAIR